MTAYLDPSALAAAGRFSKLAWIGARRAAAAFASLIGGQIRAGEPRPRAAAGAGARGDAQTAVIFEMQDTVQGLIALLLPPDVCGTVFSTLCPGTDDSSATAESALREVGNIVASHAVSAVADHLGGRITLSVPVLVREGGGLLFDRLLAERRAGEPGLVTEIELRDSGERRGLFLFAPDAQ
jgi:chemotaxis protein CheY-P-specific phosphatase CheC